MPRYAAAMDGTGPYEVVIYTSNSGTVVNVSLYWQRTGSVGYTSYNGGATYNVTIQGVSVASGSYNFQGPAGGPIGEQYIGGGSYNVGAVGSALCAGYFNTDTSGAGYGGVSGYQSVATVPPAPSNVSGTPDQITTRGMRYQFTGNGDGGSGIIRWEYECWPTGGAPTGLGTSSGTTTRNDLLPATEWNWHARGVNAIGAGPWSSVAKGTTLAASASTMNVAASIQGTSATLTPTLSNTMPSVDTWLVDRRVQGTTTPVTSYSFSTSSYTATGLAQGTIYEWRVAARVTQNGVTYTSPYSSWQAVQQPNPNTSPGTYFDGSSAATGDATFSWLGTTNNSVSQANGKSVRGWAITTGYGGILSQQVGGRTRTYAARITYTADTTAPGQIIVRQRTDSRSQVAEGGRYNGSIYVQIPARDQLMGAGIEWFDGSGTSLGTDMGDSVLTGPNPGLWTRLVVSATAPAGAVEAALFFTDVAGTGWTAWVGGDVVIADNAMLSLGLYPYFDGATPDDANFTYDWLGTPDESTSTATVVLTSTVDPLADPDCPPPPAPPRPPIIEDECIDEVGTWRRYWAIIPAENIAKWLANVPTITLTSGNQATRQARIRLWENPDELDPDSFIGSQDWVSEQIVSFIPPGATFVLDGVSETARATVGDQTVRADHLLFGSGGGPASWPIMKCGIAYLMSVDVPLDAPAGNLTVDVALTNRF